MSKAKTMHNLLFLEDISKRTVIWRTTHGILGGKNSNGQMPEFTKYKIPKNDFKKIISIIKEEFFLVVPHENLMGAIDGYCIHDLDGKLLLIFGESNLPTEYGFTLDKIFTSVVRTDQNLDIHAQLKKEKKVSCKIHKEFAEYCY